MWHDVHTFCQNALLELSLLIIIKTLPLARLDSICILVSVCVTLMWLCLVANYRSKGFVCCDHDTVVNIFASLCTHVHTYVYTQ